MDKKFGPKMMKLISRFMAQHAIPPRGGLKDGIEMLVNTVKRTEAWRYGVQQAVAAVSEIKAAHDNPYGDDDEVIAGAILDRIEQSKEQK